MAVLSPPFALGAAAQLLSGRLLRNTLGAVFLPGAGVTAVSGVLAGPANTQGELTLAAGVITVQPFKAVIQCSQDTTAGQYIVTNDAALPLTALTAQHATQYRRGLVVIDVDDSQVAGVASSATTDRVRVYPLDGALAASSGATALPALPDNSLALGEYLIPPTGQAITITPYNPRTTVRGGILPVLSDASTVTGHAGAAPTHDGQYRDHPTLGLQRGSGATWGDPIVPPSIAYPGVGGQSGPAGFPAPRLRLQLGRVQGTGLLLDANARAAGALIGVMPVGYRPTTNPAGLLVAGTTAAGVPQLYRMDVATNGNITSTGGAAANTYYFLDHLSFLIDN